MTPDESLDVRGEICPYPDLKTRRKLREMKHGQLLEVLVDYPLSAERIPKIVEKEGHEVISVERIGEAEWKILVRVGGK